MRHERDHRGGGLPSKRGDVRINAVRDEVYIFEGRVCYLSRKKGSPENPDGDNTPIGHMHRGGLYGDIQKVLPVSGAEAAGIVEGDVGLLRRAKSGGVPEGTLSRIQTVRS